MAGRSNPIYGMWVCQIDNHRRTLGETDRCWRGRQMRVQLARVSASRCYEDRISGAKAARPGLALALEVARSGDQLVVWFKLDGADICTLGLHRLSK